MTLASEKIRCIFCGSEPSEDKDDCYVTDSMQHPFVSICIRCIHTATIAARKWAAGKIEYESWRRE